MNIKNISDYRITQGRAEKQLSNIVGINDVMIKLCHVTDNPEIKYSEFVGSLRLL